MPDEDAFKLRHAALDEEYSKLLVDREMKAIDKMVFAYRNGKATYEALFGIAAVISELRTMQNELDRQAMNEIQQLEKLHG
jgi:hypothetical protein